MCRDCGGRLGGWLLRRAPECQVNVSRLRRTPRGVAASASPRVPSECVTIAEDASGGGCFGEPPSAKLMCRDCGGRLGGWLLRRAPECQVDVPRLRRTPRGVATSASPRVLTDFGENIYVILFLLSLTKSKGGSVED